MWRLSGGVVSLYPFGIEHVEVHLTEEDDEMVRWLSGAPSTRETTEAHARQCQKSWKDGSDPRAFAITVNGDQAGYLDLRFQLEVLDPGQVNLSYGLYPQWRRRGIATRAVRLACDYARDEGAKQAVIRTAPANPGSAAVASRAGFIFDGRITEPEGVTMDHFSRDLRSFHANSTPP